MAWYEMTNIRNRFDQAADWRLFATHSQVATGSGGPGTAAPRRSGYSELGSIVQLEAFLPQGNDEHCCECLDAYAAVHVFSQRLPIVFTFIGRIDDLSAQNKLCDQWFFSIYPPRGGKALGAPPLSWDASGPLRGARAC